MPRSFDVWNFLSKIYSFQCSQVPSPLVLRVVIMVRHMRHLAARCLSCSPTLSHTCWCVSSSLAAHIFRSFFRDRMCHQLVTLFVFSQNDPAHSQAWSNLNYGEKDLDIICSDCSAFFMFSESLFPLRPAWIYIPSGEASEETMRLSSLQKKVNRNFRFSFFMPVFLNGVKDCNPFYFWLNNW